MKQLFFLAGVVCLIAMLLPACAPAPEPEPEVAPEPVFDQAAEEAAVRDATEQFMAAYNKHDPQAVAALIDEECRQWGDAVKGKAAFAKWYGERFERSKDLINQIKLSEEIGIDFVTPDIAIHKFREETTGVVDADGNPQPLAKGLRAYLYVKKNGQWLRRAQFRRPIED